LILLHWIRTSKEQQSHPKAGFKLCHLGRGLSGGTASTPRLTAGERKPTAAETLTHYTVCNGPILMTHKLVASYEYSSVTRKVLI
jgi:hypothetical protein